MRAAHDGRADRRRGRRRDPQRAAAAGLRDLAAGRQERGVVGVPVRRQVGAGRGRGIEVVVAAAVVALGDRAGQRLAVLHHRVRSAGVLDVTHDVGALPAVPVGRVLLPGGLGRVRRAPLHGAEVVRHLVQEALRPPAPLGGARCGRAVAAEEDRREAAAVVHVGRAGDLAGGALDGLAEAVLLPAAGEAVGQDDRVARAAGGAELARDGGRDRAEVVHVAGARTGQRDALDVDVLPAAARAHVEAQRLGAAVLGRQEALHDGHVGLQRARPAGEAVGAVGGECVDDLELGLVARRDRVGGVVARRLVAAPGGGEARVALRWPRPSGRRRRGRRPASARGCRGA